MLALCSTLALAMAGAGDAQAQSLLSTSVRAPTPQLQSCIARPLAAGRGVTTRDVTAPDTGWITASLQAAGGDWDVAVFDRATGRRVAGSAFPQAAEHAQGFALAGQRLVVQACRRSGSARSARLVVDSTAVHKPATSEVVSIVRVITPSAARKRELSDMGMDLNEHGGKGYMEVVLHGADDARRLRDAKFSYVNLVGNLAVQSVRDRAADARGARSTARAAGIPSGRTRYRRLDDYNQEMKTLAARNPDLVKPLTLPLKTLTGLPVQGIEITRDAQARDGKPVFLLMGIHHAREWPAGENAMEFAYDLLKGYRAGDPKVRRLMASTRTIVVPVVNPDGFNTSREAGEAAGFGGGRPGVDSNTETANLATPYEYQRKNCRVNSTDPGVPDPEQADCTQAGRPNVGLSQFGVDPNRNYGGFWGGPGASVSGEPAPGGDYAQDYRGDAPFSERETRNIRALISARQVTTLITNHTFSDLVLRPPGIQSQGPPPDEAIYKALGDSMAANNGYTSEPSYQLYDTTGSTEDWSYYATGGLGFTFEIGLVGFHPPFAENVAQYEGTTAEAGNRGGNRAAYFKALENTAESAKHSVLAGKAPPGAILRLRKSFGTETSPVLDADGVAGPVRVFPDTLDSTMEVPSDGTFSWGINPSTRPVVAKARGRQAAGPPSGPQSFPSMTPAAPCGAGTPDNPACYRDFDFTVPSGAGVDNAVATVEVNWQTAASDYDITVFQDSNNDGSSAGETKEVGTSAQGTTNNESTTFGEPGEVIAGKRYVVRVVNFAGAEPYTARVSYKGPEPLRAARKESYTLTCEGQDGKVGVRQLLQLDRGQRQSVDFSRACAKVARQCVSTKGGIRRTGVGQARLGRTRTRQRKLLKGTLLSDRPKIDRYCVKKGGGSLRVGYPTSRLTAKLSKKTRKRIRRKAVLLLSTSKAFKLSRSKVGTKTRKLRKRLKGERRYKVGRNVWYVAGSKKARLLFRTRKGKVREMGIADRRLTATRSGTVRLLRAWDKRGKTKRR